MFCLSVWFLYVVIEKMGKVYTILDQPKLFGTLGSHSQRMFSNIERF